jgi:uncharacterized protein (TIGR03083 family)
VRQRRRLVAALAALDDDQWHTPSRCEGWTAQDVVNHLVVTDGFWLSSIDAGLAGAPSRVLAGFDPKATPAALADAMRALPPEESLAQLVAAADALCAAVEALDERGWSAIAEAPPGHLPVRLLAHHALWDGWVHERDIFLPLGIAPDEEPDEVRSSLRYAAALGPGFALSTTPDARGSLVLEVIGGERVVVDVDGSVRVSDGAAVAEGALVLRGTAVELLEVLSIRAPMTFEVPPDQRWLVAGLAEVFETDGGAASRDPAPA